MKNALQPVCSESYHPNRCTLSQLGSSMKVQSEHEGLGIVHEDAIECVNQRIKGGEHRGQHDQMIRGTAVHRHDPVLSRRRPISCTSSPAPTSP